MARLSGREFYDLFLRINSIDHHYQSITCGAHLEIIKRLLIRDEIATAKTHRDRPWGLWPILIACYLKMKQVGACGEEQKELRI